VLICPGVDSKVEAWKNRLLDLGKRNRFINYQDTKRSNLKIISPNCFSLLQSFVQDEKPIVFPYFDERSDQEDADSSQQEAVLCAKRGISFVLQGPPDTGKSQTITDIIAECLADGKKVLFVSEKMVALDVVYKRLTGAGLDDFCLILHNYKANKRAVLDQLGATLSLSQKKATISNEAYQKLDLLLSNKQKLNEYAYQIFEIVQPLGKSIYDVYGLLANLDSYEDLIFTLDNISSVNNQQYNQYNYLLSQLSVTIGKMSNDYKSNPWYGEI